MDHDTFSVSLRSTGGYRFVVDFGREGVPPLLVDEPPPLGGGEGPGPAVLLAAAVGDCMSASLKYCLERARIEVEEIRTRVDGTLERNERGRLRIGSLRVRIEPRVSAGELRRVGRCLEIFEDFCVVGQSVRRGIDLAVEIAMEPTQPAQPVA